MMHADLVKLIDLQSKDAAVAAAEQRLADLGRETAGLDETLQRARDALDAARRAATESQRRRDELETKIDSYRILQDRRRQRLEQVRNPKDASTLMTELDLAQSVMAKEENDWVRSAEMVVQLEVKLRDEERSVTTLEEAQAPERAEVASRRVMLEAERDEAVRAREAGAAQLDKALRARYERLRRLRANDVVVPLVGGACGACHTTVPMNRRSLIRAGQVIDACEACGAILYPSEPAGSA
jgi:predicted  nucleic acid-binding Zn-ribbon protein